MALPGRLHDATSWIGRSVLGASAGAVPGKDGGYAGEIALPEGADDVIISYVDATGAVVHSEQLGAQSAGTVPFAWNGKDAAGEAAATGPLKLVVTAPVKGEAAPPVLAPWPTVPRLQSPPQCPPPPLLPPLAAPSPTH